MEKIISKIVKVFLSLVMVLGVLQLPSLKVSSVFANTDETPVEETAPETETTAEPCFCYGNAAGGAHPG